MRWLHHASEDPKPVALPADSANFRHRTQKQDGIGPRITRLQWGEWITRRLQGTMYGQEGMHAKECGKG